MDQCTLLVCRLVCKEWLRTLDFLLWEELQLVQLVNRFQAPMTDDFVCQHAPFVQRLSIHIKANKKSGRNMNDHLCLRTIDFPKLASLEIGIQRGQPYVDWALHLEDLSSELFRLMLESSSMFNNGGHGLPVLQVLKITEFGFKFLPRDWMTLWETLWSRLQVLSLIGPWWGKDAVFPEEADKVFFRDESVDRQLDRHEELCNRDEMRMLARRHGPSWTMRDLTMICHNSDNESVYMIQEWMVEQCPNLVRLEWDMGSGADQMETIRNLILKGSRLDPPQFQNLEALAAMPVHAEFEFMDMIQAMPRLTELDLKYMHDFKDSTWDLLKAETPRHLATIRILDVTNSRFSSPTLIDMLCSLPNLEVFRAHYITDEDLLDDPRPWACRKTLKNLYLDFEVSSESLVDARSLVVSRLAELEQLEELHVCNSYSLLDLSLPEGLLTALKPSRNLKKLTLEFSPESSCPWGLAEIAWVRKNFPKLKNVGGVSYKDEVRREDQFAPIRRPWFA